jgi:hypothetical protein
MGIVTAERVHRFLSEPNWSEKQWQECADLCDEYEDELVGALHDSPITPVPWHEIATVLDTGLLATTYPVYSVTSFQGAAVDDTHPLPAPWVLQRHRVRAQLPSGGTLVAPNVLSLDAFSFGVAPRIQGMGAVEIDYMAGWGPEKALYKAIRRKVAAVMVNRHDQTIVLDDSGAPTGRQIPGKDETWTDAELAPLGVFRNPRGLVGR